MRMYLISDNDDTLTGMRLAGVTGAVVHDQYALKMQLEKACADEEIAIIIITEKINRDFYELVNEHRLSKTLPLIVEIPDRHGTARPKDFITRYVREAIGVKI